MPEPKKVAIPRSAQIQAMRSASHIQTAGTHANDFTSVMSPDQAAIAALSEGLNAPMTCSSTTSKVPTVARRSLQNHDHKATAAVKNLEAKGAQ